LICIGVLFSCVLVGGIIGASIYALEYTTPLPISNETAPDASNKVYEYWLRGNEGDEVVSIIDDNNVNTITLNKTKHLFMAKSTEIRILFTNDNGPRDVFFRSDLPTTIKSLRFNEWNCGKTNEKPQCVEVSNGQFFQSDTYTITFEDSTCKLGKQDRFQVAFHNKASYPIDIIWKTDSGKEKLMKSKLAPGSKIVFGSYSTHRWFFKRSSSNDRLLANANGITEEFFEGCHFKASTKDRLIVIISDGFKYWLKGRNGDEHVIIADANSERSITLSTRDRTFATIQQKITITFTNDNGPRDVFFRSDVPTSIKIPNRNIRDGVLAWSGNYTIMFNGKNVLSIMISFNILIELCYYYRYFISQN